ncbi:MULTISPECIES: catalase [unclassified Streptomyces]|uniref:catalase n=1 Tax=unclassified Streptomyces TaxID=2593676 RepID=UPI0001C1A2AE|nr:MULTISPECIES: catalase [unclassified Streptomyces]MYR69979.1 catalase [Streptomyces sp. SID4939]MYS02176.1 catalase [Streptomyces sp. SID4940]MYT66490.1 catalase [Streptomyces sp. SID8357]MYT83411.1 catalase [Streptomyces sp. SID8360]MYU34124.1 catalase [Streptomyces sp. SID8358]MYW35858.1 catalase [Streptomyces sp. SID1]MYX73670.1 catalase [Streptomyces sp. SID3915]
MTETANKGADGHDDRPHLTNRQGHPVYDNQNQRTVGARGPATLENYQFLEKISHFDRERIPERVVHARGVTTYGYFEAYGKWGDEPIGRYTRAGLFQEAGRRTDVAVRFSTVIGGRDSSEAARDPRGFAVKFYTEEGNWDLVGNNLGVFFIRDAIKFPDVIHALKPDPVSHEQKPARIFDFMSQTPESMHMLVNLFSPRGIPADYRHMQGFGVNTYKWVNAEGDTVLVKYHWLPKQGVSSMTEEDAANVQAGDLGHATKDLYEAIGRGDHPEWELVVQMMSDDDHPELDFDPLDDTKTWPEQDFPPKPVGRMVLDRVPDNYFAENEQASFGTGVLVDGLDFSDDKMLVGRTFSYSDTQRYRVGPNYLQLPVNQAKHAHVATNQRDGQMAYDNGHGGENPEVNYEPSITGGLREYTYPTHDEQGPVIEGRLTRARIPRTNDYLQAGQRFQLMEKWEQDDLVKNFTDLFAQCARPVQERMVWHCLMADNDLGLRVGEGIGISASDVAHLPPLATQNLSDEEKKRLARLGGNPPRDVTGLTMTHCVPNKRHVVER